MKSQTGIFNINLKVTVIIVLIASALFLPYGYRVDLGPGPDGIRAVLWEYLDAPWFSGIRFVRLGQMLEALIYTFPTYIHIYQVYNLYNGTVNRNRMIAVGILCATFPGIISSIRVVGWLQGWTQPPPPLSDPYFPIYIPIPSIILISFLLIKSFPVNTTDQLETG